MDCQTYPRAWQKPYHWLDKSALALAFAPRGKERGHFLLDGRGRGRRRAMGPHEEPVTLRVGPIAGDERRPRRPQERGAAAAARRDGWAGNGIPGIDDPNSAQNAATVLYAPSMRSTTCRGPPAPRSPRGQCPRTDRVGIFEAFFTTRVVKAKSVTRQPRAVAADERIGMA